MDCFLPQYEIVAKYYYCPFWECLDSGDIIDSGYCQCAAFTGLCEFCTNNFAGDMSNCETGHPNNAYYDGYSVCAIADCCSNPTTAPDKSLCILRNNQTDVPTSAEADEVIIGNNETHSKNQTDIESPVSNDLAKNETEKPPDGINENVAAGTIESGESTEKTDGNGAAETTQLTESSMPSSASMQPLQTKSALYQPCALLGVLNAFVLNFL